MGPIDQCHVCEEHFNKLPIRINVHRLEVQVVGAICTVLTTFYFILLSTAPCVANPILRLFSFLLGVVGMFLATAAAYALDQYYTQQCIDYADAVFNWIQRNGALTIVDLTTYNLKINFNIIFLTFFQYHALYACVLGVGLYWFALDIFVCIVYFVAHGVIVFTTLKSEYNLQVAQCSDIVAITTERCFGITANKKYVYRNENNEKRVYYFQ